VTGLFAGTLGAKVIVLKPREHKGIIEWAHDYLETSFLLGRRVTSGGLNGQLQDGWRWRTRVGAGWAAPRLSGSPYFEVPGGPPAGLPNQLCEERPSRPWCRYRRSPRPPHSGVAVSGKN